MKPLILVCFFTVINLSLFAQNTEFSVHAHTGLFYFGGESAERNSYIGSYYANNPYGTGSSFSYAFYLQLQRMMRNRVFIGVQSGYELLASRVHIDEVHIGDMIVQSDGHVSLENQFILVHPFAGRRFQIGVPADISFGADFGIGLKSTEKGNLQDSNLEIDHERDAPAADCRLRVDATAYCGNTGFTVGYSYGVTNYTSGMYGRDSETYSRFLRLGVSYVFR